MAKKKSDGGVYRVTEIIGTSATSWEDAAKNAVETAAKSLRDLRIAEVAIFQEYSYDKQIYIFNLFSPYPLCRAPTPIETLQQAVVKILGFKKQSVCMFLLSGGFAYLSQNFFKCA